MKKNIWKMVVVAALIVVVAVVVAGKNKDTGSDTAIAVEQPEATVQANGADGDISVDEPEISASDSEPGQTAQAKPENAATTTTTGKPSDSSDTPPKVEVEKTDKTLPMLVDLGSKSCVPCKMMAPILDELKNDYKDKFAVEFIDVWENRAAGEKYGVRSIPTQIFYDENGEEFSRHIGFMSKEDILKTFRENGINVD